MPIFEEHVSELQIHLSRYPVCHIGNYIVDVNLQNSYLPSSNWSKNPAVITIPYPQSLLKTDVLVDPILNDISTINILQGISARVFVESTNGTQITFSVYS
jgi:hypothetical protein